MTCPFSTNAQLAAQLDEANSEIENCQKLLQKAAHENVEFAKDADRLRTENESLNEELQEARAMIKSMKGTHEEKTMDEALSPKAKGSENKDIDSVPENDSVDPLGVTLSPKQEQNTDQGVKDLSKDTSTTAEASDSKGLTQLSEEYWSTEVTILQSKVEELAQSLAVKTEESREMEKSLEQRTTELGKQKAEHDEKMKKMKAIFAAANKNLNEYRQSIATKDTEIEELKAKLENQPTAEAPTLGQSEEQAQIIQDLEADLKNQSDLAASKLGQMESKYRQSHAQLEKLRQEYQQYKQRASLLLQQQQEAGETSDDSKIRELQTHLDSIASENRSITKELQETESKRSSVESELQLALDQIARLESTIEISHRQERQQSRRQSDLERSLKEAQQERQSAESRFASLQELREAESQSLRQELGGTTKGIEDRLAKKEEENTELHRILDRTGDELAAAKQEIQTLRDLVSGSEAHSEGSVGSKAMASPNNEQDYKGPSQLSVTTTTLAPRTSFSAYEQDSPISRASSAMSLSHERQPVYSTLSDLLATKPFVERQPFQDAGVGLGLSTNSTPTMAPTTAALMATSALNISKEREYQIKLQHLTELLNESEAGHQRLLDQEKVLKEEIRSLDRAERRQNLNVDYLKNIVLKYLESTDREQLLPVLTTVLQLSPAEVASLRKRSAPASTSSLVLGGLFGGSG
ncbi:hypothetical protein BGW38_001150 [Lunasporangiospora selenospora]|uniref:GRIP domain-containing protein n=1 Tax=Lunasporangiospora selenospora TaxID=979761 RepID=A0A9P6G1U4_9FUNG|nr:hypothetical protein BGW38_001150 [Lunasporangiospora selenospora]